MKRIVWGIRPRSPLAIVLIVLGFFAAAPAVASAATKFVDSSAADTSGTCTQADPCDTIQEGVDAAAAGDTVQVASGTYQEQVDIDKALTLTGSTGSTTRIVSPPTANLQDKFDPGDRRPVVFVHDVTPPAGVNINALEVDGDGQAGLIDDCSVDFYGIAYHNAGGTVDNVRVTHVRNQPLNGCQGGLAIYNLNADATARSWTVSNSQVVDFQKNGITANTGDSTSGALTATITGNTVQGAGPSPVIAQNGIQLWGAGGTVSDNTVSGAACDVAVPADACGPDPVSDIQAAGLLLIEVPTGLSVTGNTFTGNDAGILEDGALGTVALSGNQFTNNRFEGVFTDSADLTATGNRFSGGDNGIAAVGYDGFGAPTVTLRGNNITGAADDGVLVATDVSSAPNPTLTAFGNRIVGNGTGVDNATDDGSVDAQNNWWGCNEGPNQPGCDTTAGTVDANPWLVLGLAANPTTIAPGGDTSQLTADLRQNSDGQTAGADFPDGTDVAFATGLGSVTSPGETSGGAATSTLTSGATAGTATVSATLDQETVATPVVIQQTVSGPGPSDTCQNAIKGKSGKDKLVGTSGGDDIRGKAGNDKLDGKAGDDCVNGGKGNDKVAGGANSDLLKGAGGNDRIKAADGEADTVNCGKGKKDRAKVDAADEVAGNCERVKTVG